VAKIFYCGGSSKKLGVLRAVMPFTDLKPLMSEEILDYIGESFPELMRLSNAAGHLCRCTASRA
jgi:hypothetical protein